MHRFLSNTRYLVVLPVLGLAIAAAVFFIFGGFGLISLLVELSIASIDDMSGVTPLPEELERG